MERKKGLNVELKWTMAMSHPAGLSPATGAIWFCSLGQREENDLIEEH